MRIVYSIVQSHPMSDLMWDGASLVTDARLDIREHGVAIRVERTTYVADAIAGAPGIYAELEHTHTGKSLLELVERYLRQTCGHDRFAREWQCGLSPYESLDPRQLQFLARRLMQLQSSQPQELAALSLLAYALLGLAYDRWEHTPPERLGAQCALCYRTALWPSKYCRDDHVSREKRLMRTKKRGAQENIMVSRRRGVRVRSIARRLRRTEGTIYSRLYRQLFGMTGRLNALPPPLEQLEDDRFATGARIGRNGAAWFVYLWQELPRIRQTLGLDWADLVSTAITDGDWSYVFERLRRIDLDKECTDAYKWAVTLIEAEEWLEATEIELGQRPPPGRPATKPTDPRIRVALIQLDNRTPISEVARVAGVAESTIYRWKAKRRATGSATT